MRKKGFTFVELLIAVVIGAFVTVTAVAAMRGIVSSQQTHQQLTELSDEMRYACRLIKNDLKNIYRNNDYSKAKFELFYLDGGGDASSQNLVFYTVSQKKARPLQPEGDVYEVHYFVKRDLETGRSVLMRRYCPVVPGVVIAEEARPGGILAPVAEDVVSLQVRCYDGVEWSDEWNEKNGRFPEIVEIALLAGERGSKQIIQRSWLINIARMKTEQAEAEGQEQQNYESYMNDDFSEAQLEGAEK